MSLSTNKKTNADIGEFNIASSDCEKLLGIENKLTFDCHVSDMQKSW